MNALIKTIKADKIVYFSCIIGIVALTITSAFVAFFYTVLPPLVPLYNQMPWGESRLGTKNELFIILSFGIGIYAINVFLAQFLYNTAPLISRILSITTILASIFVLLLIARTILIVT